MDWTFVISLAMKIVLAAEAVGALVTGDNPL
jgi:hypothetical protein